MRTLSAHKLSNVLKTCACVFAVIFCFFGGSLRVQGQTAEFTQNASDSHAMTLEVPLTNYPGRGDSLPVKLIYSSQGLWRIGFINSIQVGSVWRSTTEAIYAEHSTAGWTTTLDVPKVEWPRQDDVYWSDGKAYTRGSVPGSTFRVAQLFMHMPDGSTHEMRKQDAVYADTGVINMVGTFYSVDSSRMRYDSTGQHTGTLYLPDGTRYFLGTSTVQRIDRNGNTLNYNVSTRQWTDTLGRVIGMPWPQNPGPGDYTYSIPGLNNSTTTYTIKFRSLSDSLTPGSEGLKVVADYYLNHIDSPPTGSNGANFPQANSSSCLFHSGYSDPDPEHPSSASYTYVIGRGQAGFVTFNPTVLSEILLPNGLSYKFSFNSYGELDKVIYPTGGYQRYQYAAVAAVDVYTAPYTQGSRGMISRWLSPNGTGGADEAQWQYSTGFSPITVTAPDGTVTETYLYYPLAIFDNQFGYQDARRGLVAEERIYAPLSQGGAMLRRSLYSYGVTTSITNKPSGSGDYTAYRNPRLEKAVSVVLDTGGAALAKTVTYGYIDNGYQFTTGLDQTALTQTHFQSVDQTTAQSGLITAIPEGTTASRVEAVYLDQPAYQTRNILNLPTSVVVKGIVGGALQTVSRTDSFYDEASYALLTYEDLTGPDYIDPQTTARGNVTTTRRYSDIGLGLYLDTHAQFDQCGNVLSTWNERGVQSQVEYSSTYKHAYVTKKTSAVPDPSGTYGSSSAFISTSVFDYTTGLALTTTDVNGQTTSYGYQNDQGIYDSLNRLRKVTRPDGGWTKFTYNDEVGNLFVLTEKRLDSTRTVKSYKYLDPLGRASRMFESEGDTNYIVRDTIFDQIGRVWKVSNPYRTSTLDGIADLSHTSNWTISAYDSLGRIRTVTLPDASVVQTDYQGIYTTVTDQAGRQLRQKVDALGRVVRVDEPNSSGSLGAVDSPVQPTSYEYDTQGNLVHIIQGSSPAQHRYFKFDALGRLTYEHQVEQTGVFAASDPITGHGVWSRKLVYDENIDSIPYAGLLTSVSDARNVETRFRYDNLNRAYQITYSDSTPTVTNKYDQARTNYFNKGHLTEAFTAAVGSTPSTGQIYNFDVVGRVASSEQMVDAQSYTMSYGYNLDDDLTSETYPSGRIVTYGFDNAARLSQVSSGATVYASQFDYTSPSGLLKSVTLGNAAVESYVRNSRLQLQSLDLTINGTQLQHYDYKYGVYNPATNSLDETKNSGQIAQIEGFIATQKQWQQRFAYDTVGRLSSAREFRGDNNQQSYAVNYEYDVFGNRYQKQAQNPNNPFAQIWVEDTHINQATNRFNSGVTYDNAGNITVDSKFRNRKFQYDANNRQKQSRNLDDSGAVDSVFDALGQRLATQVGGSITAVLVYDAMGKLVAEYNSSAVGGGTQYVFSDPQGSPRLVSGPEGTVVARHDYLPFGEDVLNGVAMRAAVSGYGGSEAARQKYAGMETNDATGMGHTLWRQYDSLSARWTAPDPYNGSMDRSSPQSFNRYTYVSNDPVNKVDPSGLMLSDIGVYQTANPEVARRVERAEDQGIKNWVASRSGQNYRTVTSRAWLGRGLNAAIDRRMGTGDVTASAAITGILQPQTPSEGTTLHYWPARVWRDADGNEVDKSPYGHIALQLSDGTYISYWPGEPLGAFDLGKEVEPSLNRTYFDDYNGEHRTDSQVFTIYGLDEAKIRQWWNNGKGHGKFSSGNSCADIVTEALRQGGFTPRTTNLIWSTPADVWNGAKAEVKARQSPKRVYPIW